MGFYFIAHALLGLTAAAAGHIILQARSAQVWSVPIWFHHPIVGILSILGFLSCIAAVITSLVNNGITWAGVTLAEIALGAFIASALPRNIIILVTLASPVSILLIMGALWRFWYI